MKKFLALTFCLSNVSALTFAAGTYPPSTLNDLENVPFYFSVPDTARLTTVDPINESFVIEHGIADNTNVRIETRDIRINGLENEDIGLKVFVVKVNDINNSQEKADAVKILKSKEILKDGDVVLSFRPMFGNTIPYMHIQMGITHAGLIHTEGIKAYNIDQPLSRKYTGNKSQSIKFVSQLTSPHYLEANALHIVRPKNLNLIKFKQIIKLIIENYDDDADSEMNHEGKFELIFNRDYGTSIFSVKDSLFVNEFEKLIIGERSEPMKMYCSEFVWAVITLANCENNLIANECLAFNPMYPIRENNEVTSTPNAGFAEGPLMLLESMSKSPDEKLSLVKALYSEEGEASMSSGHKAAAESVKQLMLPAKEYYDAIVSKAVTFQGTGKGKVTPNQFRDAAKKNSEPNYSPTAFLVNTFMDSDNPNRKFDYVGTVLFTNQD